MKIEILQHAKERMTIYGISENLVKDAIDSPDDIVEGYAGRKIVQKKLDGYVLRVIYEEKNSTKIVVTAYKAKSGRHEI